MPHIFEFTTFLSQIPMRLLKSDTCTLVCGEKFTAYLIKQGLYEMPWSNILIEYILYLYILSCGGAALYIYIILYWGPIFMNDSYELFA